MKVVIAVEGTNVSQHFGRTPVFCVAEIDGSKVISKQDIERSAQGHDALAGFLLSAGADVLITGGIGQGAVSALEAAGIKIISGIKCGVNEALKLFISGKLESAGECCGGHGGHEEGHTHGEGHECKCGKNK